MFLLIWTLRVFCILSFNNWIHLKEILCGLDVAEMKPLGFCSHRQDEDWYGESFRCLPTSEKLWVPTWNSLRSQFFSQLGDLCQLYKLAKSGSIWQKYHMFFWKSLNSQVENVTLKLGIDWMWVFEQTQSIKWQNLPAWFCSIMTLYSIWRGKPRNRSDSKNTN